MALIKDNEWYSARCLWGNTWANWFVLLGSRERGKSYDVMNFFLRRFFKTKMRNTFTWIRLYESEQKQMLSNNAANLIDADLRRKYITSRGYELMTNGSKVYVIKRDSKGKIVKNSKHLLCQVLALATAGSSKGQALFDKDWLKNNPGCYYHICLDEFNRIAGQKKTFDVVENLKIQLENLIRSTDNRVRIVCIANNVGSCSDLLASWNFIPHEFGIFKLRSKGVLIHNIPNSESYIARRSKSALNRAFSIADDSNYTNEQIMDKSLIIPSKRKLIKPKTIIKFRKDWHKWFVIYDDNIIKQYNGENCKSITMRPYLDDIYMPELKNHILDAFNNRVFRYKDLITFIKFQNELEEVKSSN